MRWPGATATATPTPTHPPVGFYDLNPWPSPDRMDERIEDAAPSSLEALLGASDLILLATYRGQERAFWDTPAGGRRPSRELVSAGRARIVTRQDELLETADQGLLTR
jgi:hypothetical protein